MAVRVPSFFMPTLAWMREPTLSVKLAMCSSLVNMTFTGHLVALVKEDGVGLDLPAHDLRAEAAAALGRDGPYLELSVEDVEEGHLVEVGGLGRAPDGHLVRLFPVGYGAHRLGGQGVGDVLVAEGAFGDDVRLGETLLHIAPHHALETVLAVDDGAAGQDVVRDTRRRRPVRRV